MEYSNIIIGVVITLIIGIATGILATAGARKSKKTIQNIIESLKSKHNINITEYDRLSSYFIGVDNERKKLVYFRSESEKDDYDIFDLKNVSTITNNVPVNKNNIEENLYLILTSKENGSKIKLEFYNCSFGLSANKEIVLLLKWTNIINQII